MSSVSPSFRIACDSMVATARITRGGRPIFAKNSDRPPDECQRLVQVPRRRHEDGARLRCQYVEIPQVRETAAVLGSQPHWLWGFEHGVNEHRVAIGNETVFAKEPLGATGLAQITEITWHLRGQAGERQVPHARLGVQHNVGLGGACVVTVLKR